MFSASFAWDFRLPKHGSDNDSFVLLRYCHVSRAFVQYTKCAVFSHVKLVRGYSQAAAAARWNKSSKWHHHCYNRFREYIGYKHKYHKICGSRETQNGRPCMGILIVQSFKVNDKGVFSLLELQIP
jgi:hypothetical protein